ncbi:MAG: LCP family protein [Propionicimonas sp.]
MTFDPESPSAPRRVADPDPTSGGGAPRRTTGELSFGSAIGWTALGTLIPGLGLWRAGRRVIGAVLMGVFVVLVAGGFTLLVTSRKLVETFALQPNVLEGVAIAMLTIAVLYVALIALTHLALRPSAPTTAQRAVGALVVAALSFVVAAPMALGSSYAWTTANLVNNVFGADETPTGTQPTVSPEDPWKDKARINFLLLGGDHDSGRKAALGNRTDTVIVASVDTHTGATTLFTLPRNTARMPFPKSSPLHKYYPNGFYDGVNPANAEYFLNAMYRNVPNRVPNDVLGKTKDFGAEVMKQSVGEALGLDIDYFAMVNMDGFKDFINAIGGITVNINYRIPIGGQTDAHVLPDGYLEPGKNQHLNGRLALWYARGRYGLDDYKRMERQRCVINAVVQQTTPLNVLQNYQSIAAAGQKTITTDVPRAMLPALVELADKVKNTKLRSVVFTPGTAGFYSSNPNWDKVQARVTKALKETKSDVEASADPTAKTTKKKSDDLDKVCGYHPES